MAEHTQEQKKALEQALQEQQHKYQVAIPQYHVWNRVWINVQSFPQNIQKKVAFIVSNEPTKIEEKIEMGFTFM